MRGITGNLNYINSLTRGQWAGLANSVSFSPSSTHLTLPTEVGGRGHIATPAQNDLELVTSFRCASDSTDRVMTSLSGAMAALKPTHLIKSVDSTRGLVRSPACSS